MSEHWPVHVLMLNATSEDTKEVRCHVSSLLAELDTRTKQHPIKVREPSQSIKDLIDSAAMSDLHDLNDRLGKEFILQGQDRAKLLVMCTSEHPLAKAALKNNPDALWGAAIHPGCTLGIVYGNWERTVIWHELLHLLGAIDCYNSPSDFLPTCGLRRCIMQHEPSAQNTGPRLEICEQNLVRIQAHIHRSDSITHRGT